MEKIIEISNLTKNFKNFSLGEINLGINKGDFIGLIGENGAGKSTFLKCLAEISKPSTGEILFFNKRVDKLSNLEKENISFILDELNFPENIKIYQLNKVLKNIFTNWEEDVFLKNIEEFELDKTKKCKELSKGMKVKLNLAVSLSHKASIFILDEPTNGLDPIVRNEVLMKLKYLSKNGATIIISSHIVSDIEEFSNKIIFLHKGKIIIDEDKSELLNSYNIYNVSLSNWENLESKERIIKYKKEIDDTVTFLTLKKDGINFNDVIKKDTSISELMVLFIKGENL